MPRAIEKQHRAIAYHEAGHTAVALHFRRPFRAVSIVADDSSGGRLYCAYRPTWVQSGREPNARQQRIVLHEIMVALAGPIAEGRYLKRNVLHSVTALEDLRRAILLAGMLTHRESDLFDRCLACVAPVVTGELWPNVERLATALLERHTMRRAEVEQILAEPSACAARLSDHAERPTSVLSSLLSAH